MFKKPNFRLDNTLKTPETVLGRSTHSHTCTVTFANVNTYQIMQHNSHCTFYQFSCIPLIYHLNCYITCMPLLMFILQSLSCNLNPSTHSYISTLPTGRPHLDTMELQHKATQLLTSGLATTTRATYTAGQQRFSAFCQTINISPIPA